MPDQANGIFKPEAFKRLAGGKRSATTGTQIEHVYYPGGILAGGNPGRRTLRCHPFGMGMRRD